MKGAVALALLAAFLAPVTLAHFLERAAPTRKSMALIVDERPERLSGEAQSLEGALTYVRNCGMCHGHEAVGKVGVAPSLSNPDFLALATDDFIRTTVREGRLGTAMAPRRDVPQQDVGRIIGYLRTLPGHDIEPVSLDVEYTASGDAQRGREHFSRYCSSCHGAKGGGYVERGTAPGIGLPGFLHIATDAYIRETVRRGRVGTAMRSFTGSLGLANLSDQDIQDIIVFLRTQDPANEPGFATEIGRQAYDNNCAACHQKDGAGLVGVAPSLRSQEFLALATDEFIRKTVRWGRPGTTMVPRHGVTDWELDGIVSYLRSLPGNGQSDLVVDATLTFVGDANRGRRYFAIYCAPCHGPQGEGYARGGSGPGIGLPGFLEAVPDDYIFHTVKHGRTGTAMRPFYGPEGLAQLADGDIKDIIVFLRSRAVLP
ncbi:MAG: c-type cytochrome [Candidatus Latescibacterota bacterium]|nr:c-type cytochrome [Candidatus Latescibacterota bacterium]